MLLAGIYWVTLTICAGYAFAKGAGPERAGAAIMVAGSIASVIATSALGFRHVELGIFGVDLVVLASLLTLALRVDRHWPLWITGFQLVGVIIHAAMMLRPEVVPRAYALAQGFWGYPMLIALVVGTLSVQRRTPARPF
jgi:cytochrome bd-type quinol oxidase subunit 2